MGISGGLQRPKEGAMKLPLDPYLTLYQFENEARADCGCYMEKSNGVVRFYFCAGHAAETKRLAIAAGDGVYTRPL